MVWVTAHVEYEKDIYLSKLAKKKKKNEQYTFNARIKKIIYCMAKLCGKTAFKNQVNIRALLVCRSEIRRNFGKIVLKR